MQSHVTRVAAKTAVRPGSCCQEQRCFSGWLHGSWKNQRGPRPGTAVELGHLKISTTAFERAKGVQWRKFSVIRENPSFVERNTQPCGMCFEELRGGVGQNHRPGRRSFRAERKCRPAESVWPAHGFSGRPGGRIVAALLHTGQREWDGTSLAPQRGAVSQALPGSARAVLGRRLCGFKPETAQWKRSPLKLPKDLGLKRIAMRTEQGEVE